MEIIKKITKWATFIWERFPPYSYFPFMLLYFAAHYVFYLNDTLVTVSITELLVLFLGTIIFFFKLRLYDEIKDYKNDLKVYPNRPLTRGLLTHRDIQAGICISILLELITFSIFGLNGLIAIIVPITYSLLMFKEFFVRDWIRSHLTLYAISHTLVSTLFSIALLATFKSVYIWNLDKNSYLFALLSWFLFNIFEFGRKTFISSEERRGVDSYSKIYGRFGAILLVVSMAICALFLLNSLSLQSSIPITPFISISGLLLSLVALLYATFNKPPIGKIYRGLSSLFIAWVYFIFIAVYAG